MGLQGTTTTTTTKPLCSIKGLFFTPRCWSRCCRKLIIKLLQDFVFPPCERLVGFQSWCPARGQVRPCHYHLHPAAAGWKSSLLGFLLNALHEGETRRCESQEQIAWCLSTLQPAVFVSCTLRFLWSKLSTSHLWSWMTLIHVLTGK